MKNLVTLIAILFFSVAELKSQHLSMPSPTAANLGLYGDKHAKQYTHGGKNRPKNPNQKKGAEERRNKGKTNN